MSIAQQLANQSAGFGALNNYMQQQQIRGEQRIDDFNLQKQEFDGSEVAHRNGLSALKLESETPRLLQEQMLKPVAKKALSYLAQKSGLKAAVTNAFKGNKVENIYNNLKTGAKALEEGRYSDAVQLMTKGRGIEGFKEFAKESLAKASEIRDGLKDTVEGAKTAVGEGMSKARGLVNEAQTSAADAASVARRSATGALQGGRATLEDLRGAGRGAEGALAEAEDTGILSNAREGIDNFITRKVGSGATQEVRQLGGAKFKTLSEDARANIAKGSVDEDEIPYRTEELARGDVYKGLQSGRFSLRGSGGLRDEATGKNFEASTGQRLPGGVRANVGEGGYLNLETESGAQYVSSADGGQRLGLTQEETSQQYRVEQARGLERDFGGSRGPADPRYQQGLDADLAAREGPRVDLSQQTGRPVDPRQLPGGQEEMDRLQQRLRADKGKGRLGKEAEYASKEDVASARVPKAAERVARGNIKVGTEGLSPAEREQFASLERDRQAKVQQQRDAEGGGGGAEDEPLLQRPGGAEDRIQRNVRYGAREQVAPEEERGDGALNSQRQPLEEGGGFEDSLAPMRGNRGLPTQEGEDAARARVGEARQGGGRTPQQKAQDLSEEEEMASRASSRRVAETPLESVEQKAASGAQRARMTDSGISKTIEDAPDATGGYVNKFATTEADLQRAGEQAARASRAAIKEGGEKAFGEGVAKTVGKEAASGEAEAEAAAPGVGEVAMGVGLLGGIVKGFIDEHREKKTLEAAAPVAPAQQQAIQASSNYGSQRGVGASGISFNVAPVISSDDYHHL